MAALSFQPVALAARLIHRSASRPPATIAAFSISSSSSSSSSKQLVLYSKPGCCLCDGLKEKLNAALSLGGPHSLSSVHLQVRDITENPEWERLYQYEIPVLAKILPDGTEVIQKSSVRCLLSALRPGLLVRITKQEMLPRLSPRIGVEVIQKKIAAALEL